eukprot:TRINITY_DN280_c0_g2_i1.p1 TRINITY_DN280_c0_g2~~TRINITY_DN280_c0_g2_i1.p1  ORF type:complete len:1017 (-),score=173.76 TRINITY_DN280_c0_g2_i1:6366-9416(-)
MTVSIEQLYNKLSPRFPDIKQVADSVIRFERKAGGRPFAVCYVDVSARIPDSAAALNAYQDSIVASHYFEGSKSLQWSNYLYFLVDALPSQEAKAIVERDRKYARKFVLTEPELETAISPPSFQISDAAVETDILASWTEILAAANLDRAILNDESLPRRLELIEASLGQAAMPVPSASSRPRQTKQPFLRKIELQTFRDHPITRKFDLGLVTLICGANGTGKTSLMEAIELVYCGRTKRNPSSSDHYSVSATFSDGSNEIANQRRSLPLFRERHLLWYGQAEQRTNNLFQTFARFNFLNTDAAVGLAEAKDDFEEDLSKLLVGPDASKTWREIERTAGKLDEKIRELEAIRNSVELDLASYKRQIAAAGDLKQESGAVLKKLDELIAGLPWTRDEGDAAVSVKAFVELLSEFETLVKQAIRCDWVGSPVTIAKLRQFAKDTPSRIKSGEGLIQQLRNAQASERLLDQELARIQSNLASLTELSKYIEAGLPERLIEIDRLQPLISRHQQVIAGFDEGKMPSVLSQAATVSVSAFATSVAEAAAMANRQLNDARNRYSEFSVLRDESVTLGQRLREVAAQILKSANEPDRCPLCHHEFPPGELASHMHAGLDQQLEAKAAALLIEIRENERIVADSIARQSAAKWAELACQRLNQPPSINVSQLMAFVSASQKEYTDLTQARAQVVNEIGQLQKIGMTADGYRQLLAVTASTLPTVTPERVKSERDKYDEDRKRKLSERDAFTRTIQELTLATETALSLSSKASTADSAIAELRERLVVAESLLSKLQSYVARLPWPAEQPFSQLAVTINSVRQLAGDFQVTLSKEQNSVKVLEEATNRKDQIEKQLAGLLPRIERLSEARKVLSKIQNEYSLNGAMEDALRQNRTAIESIFSRLHSPAEFSGLGSSLTTLVRKNGGSVANLQQISTGQRAAFALSLFLAQNAQLRSAPPVVLIDDPIAHVDDLNCLSFLDYLREVVVTGDRQVVFATANDKLATLFERKFDFLGTEDFRRYDLVR